MAKLFLIAGHNGKGTGAKGLIDEGSETIRLRDDIQAELQKMNSSSISEIIIDNDSKTLSNVVKDINAQCTTNDLSLDIHFNAFNGSANGSEVIVANQCTAIEQEFAEGVLSAICSTIGIRNRGVKKESQSQHKTLAMCSGVKCNSILVEVCFCDSANDVACYENKYYELVTAIAQAITRTANRI